MKRRNIRTRLQDHIHCAILDHGDPGCDEYISDASVGELREAVREMDRLRAALEMVAGRRQCIDNLMSNEEIAIDALDHDEEYTPCHLTENG